MCYWLKRRLVFAKRFYTKLLYCASDILKPHIRLYKEMYKDAKKNDKGNKFLLHMIYLIILLIYTLSAFHIFSIDELPLNLNFISLTFLSLFTLTYLKSVWSKQNGVILLFLWLSILFFPEISNYTSSTLVNYQHYFTSDTPPMSPLTVQIISVVLFVIASYVTKILSNIKKFSDYILRICIFILIGSLFSDYASAFKIYSYNINTYIFPTIISLRIWFGEDKETRAIFKQIRKIKTVNTLKLKKNWYYSLGKEFKIRGKVIDKDSKNKNNLVISSSCNDESGINIRYDDNYVPRFFTIQDIENIEIGDDVEVIAMFSTENEKKVLDAYFIRKLETKTED